MAADGNVSGVRRLETSGDPAFDRLATEYFSASRLVPAIDANGIPVADVLEIAVSDAGAHEPGAGRDRFRKEQEPEEA